VTYRADAGSPRNGSICLLSGLRCTRTRLVSAASLVDESPEHLLFPHQQLDLHFVSNPSQLAPTENGGWLNQSSSPLFSFSLSSFPSLSFPWILSSRSFVSALEWSWSDLTRLIAGREV